MSIVIASDEQPSDRRSFLIADEAAGLANAALRATVSDRIIIQMPASLTIWRAIAANLHEFGRDTAPSALSPIGKRLISFDAHIHDLRPRHPRA
ncbi:MAG: hypothetical protein KGM42_10470 [Hyphomicrobiales bacterium]|nr:hypothetical protein [Hyphomicrobiales bacterium]